MKRWFSFLCLFLWFRYVELCGLCCRRERQRAEVNGIRRLPVKGSVGASCVEELHVPSDAVARGCNALVGVQVDLLVLHRPPHGPAPFPWTVFCLRCWVIFVFICLPLGSYNAGRSGAAGVRSAGFFLGDLACP